MNADEILAEVDTAIVELADEEALTLLDEVGSGCLFRMHEVRRIRELKRRRA